MTWKTPRSYRVRHSSKHYGTRKCHICEQQISEAGGGTLHYLNHVKKGEAIAVNVNKYDSMGNAYESYTVYEKPEKYTRKP